MFVITFFLTASIIALLAFRDWIKYRRTTPKDVRKKLTKVSKKILLEEWEEAENELLPLLRLGDKEVILLYLQVLRGTKRENIALEIVEKAARDFPEELQFRVEEGKILLDLGRYEGALSALKVSLPILRTESDFLLLATAYLYTGFGQEAWDLIEPLIKKSESCALFHLAGEAQFALKGYAQAIVFYRKAIASGFRNHDLMMQLGHAYRKLGQLDQAEALFRKVLAKDKSDVAAVLGLGACLEERGMYQKALLYYQATGAAEKLDPRLLMQTGIVALRLGRAPLASFAFAKVIERRGPNPILLSYQGHSLEMQHKWAEAERVYLEMIRLFPQDPKGYRALAWLFAVGLSSTISPEEGIRYANAVHMMQGDLISLEILSGCLARAGYFDRAQEIQEQLASLDRDNRERARRQKMMRLLRNCHPIDGSYLNREMVA